MTPEGRARLDELRQEQGLDPMLPWGGRSPRVLTRSYQEFTLKAQAAGGNGWGHLSDEELEEQYRRFRYGF